MQKKELYNLHEILNDFERFFPYKRLYTRIHFVDNCHIYVKVTVSEKPVTDEIWTDKEYKNLHPDTQSFMCKIWVHHEKDILKNRKNYNIADCGDPKLTLWADEIYTNKYIMSDYGMAKQFWEAKKKWTGTKAGLIFNSYDLSLSPKQLAKARKEAIHRLEHVSDELANWKRKMTEGRPVKRDIYGILRNGMQNILETCDVLFHETQDNGGFLLRDNLCRDNLDDNARYWIVDRYAHVGKHGVMGEPSDSFEELQKMFPDGFIKHGYAIQDNETGTLLTGTNPWYDRKEDAVAAYIHVCNQLGERTIS